MDGDGEVNYSEQWEGTPPEIREFVANLGSELLPSKSKAKYEAAYKRFTDWKASKDIKVTNESVLIFYFNILSKDFAPPTLWSVYSMLKSVIRQQEDIDLENFKKLTVLLKRKSEGYKPKKAKILTAEQIELFINEAPNEVHLATKVALVFGMFGACRREELVNVKVQDIRREGNMLIISIPDTKNKKPRSFGINGDFVKMVEDYAALRPAKANTERFFLNYQKGSCTIQPIGKNKFGSMPKIIADWLKLPDPALYTGHSFRRTAATLLSNAGGDLIAVKQLGGWESDRVAQSYIEESSKSKRKIGELITSDITLASTSKETSIDHLYKKPKGQNNMNNNGNGTNNLAVCNSQTITKTVFGNKGSPRINIQNCQNVNINYYYHKEKDEI